MADDDQSYSDDNSGGFVTDSNGTWATAQGDTTGDYSNWDWRKIMAAICGGSNYVDNPTNEQRAGVFSIPQTIQDAADAFYYAQCVLQEVAQAISDQTNALTGEDGPWQGAAAQEFRSTMLQVAKQAQAIADVLSGGVSGDSNIPHQLANDAKHLSDAIAKIKDIDNWYANQVADLDPSKKQDDGFVQVMDNKQVVMMMSNDMRQVLVTLASHYALTKDSIAQPQSPSNPNSSGGQLSNGQSSGGPYNPYAGAYSGVPGGDVTYGTGSGSSSGYGSGSDQGYGQGSGDVTGSDAGYGTGSDQGYGSVQGSYASGDVSDQLPSGYQVEYTPNGPILVPAGAGYTSTGQAPVDSSYQQQGSDPGTLSGGASDQGAPEYPAYQQPAFPGIQGQSSGPVLRGGHGPVVHPEGWQLGASEQPMAPQGPVTVTQGEWQSPQAPSGGSGSEHDFYASTGPGDQQSPQAPPAGPPADQQMPVSQADQQSPQTPPGGSGSEHYFYASTGPGDQQSPPSDSDGSGDASDQGAPEYPAYQQPAFPGIQGQSSGPVLRGGHGPMVHPEGWQLGASEQSSPLDPTVTVTQGEWQSPEAPSGGSGSEHYFYASTGPGDQQSPQAPPAGPPADQQMPVSQADQQSPQTPPASGEEKQRELEPAALPGF